MTKVEKLAFTCLSLKLPSPKLSKQTNVSPSPPKSDQTFQLGIYNISMLPLSANPDTHSPWTVLEMSCIIHQMIE